MYDVSGSGGHIVTPRTTELVRKFKCTYEVKCRLKMSKNRFKVSPFSARSDFTGYDVASGAEVSNVMAEKKAKRA